MQNGAIIFGGGRGIGKAIAMSLAAAKIDVVVISRTRSEVEETARSAQDFGVRAIGLTADISISEQVTDAIDTAVNFLRNTSILVNCAGWHPNTYPIENYPVDYWNKIIDVNLRGTFLACREIVPILKKAGGGRIINISSVAGINGYAHTSAYAAAKHGVIGLTRCLAAELGEFRITVNAICPGFVETQMTQSKSLLRDWVVKNSHLHRIVDPDEVAATVAFLASPNAAAITGQTIAVCAGLT